MPIISGTRFQKKEKIKAEISTETIEKIKAYCTWAGIDDVSVFLEEAARYVFDKDKLWNLRMKEEKRQAKKRQVKRQPESTEA